MKTEVEFSKNTTTTFTIPKEELKNILIKHLHKTGHIPNPMGLNVEIEGASKVEYDPYMNTDSITYEYFDGIKLIIKE